MDKKKLAAATAAVFTYIKTSEEASAYAVQEGGEPMIEPEVQPRQIIQQSNLWGVSGRQTHMQANTMMQLRMFK